MHRDKAKNTAAAQKQRNYDIIRSLIRRRWSHNWMTKTCAWYATMREREASEACLHARGISGYGYESLTKLPQVPGTGMRVLENLQKFFVG